ncbi:hypothetical protein VDGL01_06678 [Verticillium dahliae]
MTVARTASFARKAHPTVNPRRLLPLVGSFVTNKPWIQRLKAPFANSLLIGPSSVNVCGVSSSLDATRATPKTTLVPDPPAHPPFQPVSALYRASSPPLNAAFISHSPLPPIDQHHLPCNRFLNARSTIPRTPLLRTRRDLPTH